VSANRAGRPPLPRRRYLLRGSMALALLLLVASSVAVARAWLWATLPYRDYGASSAIIDIPSGTGMARALEILRERGVVRPFNQARLVLRLCGRGGTLKAGEYHFARPMNPLEVFDKIIGGDVYFHRVTVLEGLRSDEIFDLYVKAGFGTTEEYETAFRDTDILRGMDPQAVDLEGYLFPDTYSLQKGTTPRAILVMMVDRFREVLGPTWIDQATSRGLGVRGAVTLASLIERETAKEDEDPVVSSVFHNRLRLGMKLQCDPTVIYALAMRNQYDGNLRRDDLKIDSLYNTYRYTGLTPGPIGNPGASALRAAVAPASTDYLYFVSMNTGRHRFSRTLEEHNRAVWEFQKKPFLNPAVRRPS
jgi:peptidoglycan lytic transglycosylase G